MKKTILLVFLTLVSVLLINRINEMNENLYTPEIKRPKQINYLKIDFDRFKQINKDVIGWLIIKDTDINYPVLKTNNNEFYITHNFDLTENKKGSIFQDYKNISLNDKNITLYGNNLNKGMFADLRKIYNQELGNDIYIKLITETNIYTYKVYETIKNNIVSEFDYQIDITDEDYIINLKSIGGTYEYVVKAIRIEEEEC